MVSIILIPLAGDVVHGADTASLLATLASGRDIRFTYVLGVDPPSILSDILLSGEALLIYNASDSTILEVPPGVVLHWISNAGA